MNVGEVWNVGLAGGGEAPAKVIGKNDDIYDLVIDGKQYTIPGVLIDWKTAVNAGTWSYPTSHSISSAGTVAAVAAGGQFQPAYSSEAHATADKENVKCRNVFAAWLSDNDWPTGSFTVAPAAAGWIVVHASLGIGEVRTSKAAAAEFVKAIGLGTVVM